MTSPKKTCFFITPIGAEHSATRNRADWILKYMLKPVLTARYSVVRADHIAEPGSITYQVVRLLAEADLTVADLTGLNANVIYELAVRHTLNRPSIQLMDKNERLPFDLAGERTIFFTHDDVQSLERAKSELKRLVQQTERSDFICTSPISRAVDVTYLLDRSTVAGEQLATIIQELADLKSNIGWLESDQSSIESIVGEIDGVVSEIKDKIDQVMPAGFRGKKGLYIDDPRLMRLFEDIELLLSRAFRN